MPSTSFTVNPQSQFIRAGAGAGKTTKLIGTFLNFVRHFKEKNGKFPRVVMTTFTRKATQEVKERLLVTALHKNEIEIFEYINKKSFVHISTIHGLLNIFLSQFADYIKFPQEIKIIDGPQYDRTLKKQINEVLKKNPDFLEILETYSFNDLVSICKRALDFKAQSASFSYVSDDELKNLAQKQRQIIVDIIEEVFKLEPNPQKGWLAYFEHLQSVRSYLVQNDEAGFLKVIAEFPRKPTWSEAKPSLGFDAHELILKLKDELLENLYDSEEFIKKHQQLNELFHQFLLKLDEIDSERKRRTGELTISDLENLTLQIIDQFPHAAKEFSDSWDYFMIDEYQDTSPVQVKILNHFVREKPCFIVGDPQQSIYLFRGARSEVFDLKQKEMSAGGAQVDFLQTNYRSEPSLMNFINDFFEKLSPQFQPMIPKESQAENQQIPFDAFFIKSDNESEAVLNQIRYLIENGAKPQDICILSRNNKNLEAIAVKASEYGVHVQLQSASGFEEKREILDLISFNRFLYNPHDDENTISLLRSPWFFVEDSELLKFSLIRSRTKQSYWEVVNQSETAIKNKLNRYLDQFEDTGIVQVTKKFIFESEFLNFSLFYDRSGKREANIIKYLTTLARAEKSPGFSVGLFLEEQFQSLQIDSGSGNAEAQPVLQPDCVSLMTVHASKGLQFKHVIVVGIADIPKNTITDRFSYNPDTHKYSLAVYDELEMKLKVSNWSKDLVENLKQREADEKERVLYVAMTRAIETLTLVADESKKTNKNSWLSQMNWPILGESIAGKSSMDQYKILSFVSNEPVKINASSEMHVSDVRQKYSESSAQEMQSKSITEMLSGSVSSNTETNYQQQLLNLKKAQYGTDLHRVFESLKYQKTDSVLELLAQQDREAVEFVLYAKELDIKKLLQNGHNEWGFGLKLNAKFIQGQIDLWAVLEDEIHVLDYKTGSSVYSDKAFLQLGFYTMALSLMKMIPNDKKIILSVVYPIEKVISQKRFENINDFREKLSEKEKEQFPDFAGEYEF